MPDGNPRETTFTSALGWAPDAPTGYLWQAQLNASGDLAGRTVEEAQEGSPADSCYFDGAPGGRYGLSGGGWYVGGSLGYNTYGYDIVGWKPASVNYYREAGVTPCAASVTQNMLIYCNDSIVFPKRNYQYNNLVVGIDDFGEGTVSSRRGGNVQYRVWP
jgi:hypothetical protein